MENRQEKMFEMEALIRSVFKKLRHELNTVYDKELSRNEFFILKNLFENGAKKASDLSKSLDVSASHITAVTDTLIEKGWITRVRSDRDRRIVDIHITAEGESIVQRYEKRKTEFLLSKFTHFTDEEIEVFIRLFQKLQQS
ncbi:MarR family transcriptional regulator [Metabacillus fastidiosus]|uniref:MarR family transcriptional regulator n=1 Tax=Metabacillus fastidiosus TaxID=1458 RepID=A0ABU6P456_9BACI|nr:MarR family transcriptional regulator [Metabacillus fastidiosus]MED4404071.1 MarR family transcriptional regulator [Metabacillus fastidiosus]MED4462775.1 MarR family transcriptional regulator [Metabacillus fastidiosus]